MPWSYGTASIILHLAALMSIFCALVAWQRRQPGAQTLSLLMLSVFFWSLMAGLRAAANDPIVRLWMAKGEDIAAITTPIFFLVFTLNYLGLDHWATRRNVLLMSIVPALGMLLVLTNEWHLLIWNRLDLPPLNTLGAGSNYHGFGYFVLLGYSSLPILLGMGLLIWGFIQEKGRDRWRILLLILGAALPLLGGLLYILGFNVLPGINLLAFSFLVTGILLTIGMVQARIFAGAPVAVESLLDHMQDGVLVLDDTDRIVGINRAAQQAIGSPASLLLRQGMGRLPEAWRRAFYASSANGSVRQEITVPLARPLHLDLQISTLMDSRNRACGRLIVFRDITERRQAELKLAMWANELSVLNQISLAITSGLDLTTVLRTLHVKCTAAVPGDVFYIALYDETTGVIEMPLYYEKEREYWVPPPRDIKNNPGLTGYIIEDRKTLLIHDVETYEQSGPVLPVRLGGVPSRTYLGIPLMLRDKVIGVLSVQSYKPDAFSSDQVRLLETVAVQAAIAIENARLYGEVQRLAIVDELTGIYNYRGLMELGKREVERARRFKHPLALLFFDIDGFRKFNNIYSHTVGNEVLKGITQRCRAVLRSVDVFTRYGGDEFVVLLPETDQAMAVEVAKRLMNESANSEIETHAGKHAVTISVGLAMLNEMVPDLSTLVENANIAEHLAKKVGNHLEIHS